MKTKHIALNTLREREWKKQNRIASAALDMLKALEDLLGEPHFEGLPESKQEAILAAIKKARGTSNK